MHSTCTFTRHLKFRCDSTQEEDHSRLKSALPEKVTGSALDTNKQDQTRSRSYEL